jgi:hypothetical protein
MLLVGGAATVALAAPANAGDYNGVCENSEICLFWGPSFNDGVADFFGHSKYAFDNYTFKGSGYGVGQRVNDNAASMINGSAFCSVDVYRDTWMRGPELRTSPSRSRDANSLGSLANQISSYSFVGFFC